MSIVALAERRGVKWKVKGCSRLRPFGRFMVAMGVGRAMALVM